jgi:hypothetical protein
MDKFKPWVERAADSVHFCRCEVLVEHIKVAIKSFDLYRQSGGKMSLGLERIEQYLQQALAKLGGGEG